MNSLEEKIEENEKDPDTQEDINKDKDKVETIPEDEVLQETPEKKNTDNVIHEKNEPTNINVMESLKENYISFLCMFIAVYVLSHENLLLGVITFIFIIIVSYTHHRDSHKVKNILSIIHHYHHENNNFFSHFIQILLELTIIGVFVPIHYLFGTIFFNPWILLFFILFYSSVHNINYSILHVNTVHKLHHEFTETNLGPDICDIIGGTKHYSEKCVENTNHYIPNIIICALFVLITKFYWKNDDNKKTMLFTLNVFLVSSSLCLIISAIYLWYDYIKTNK